MARPSKSVRVKTGAIASDVEAVRQDVEDKLRGENVPPEPPADLTDGQREIFQFIVSGLVASDILGQLDVFVLESTAVAIDRLRYEKPNLQLCFRTQRALAQLHFEGSESV